MQKRLAITRKLGLAGGSKRSQVKDIEQAKLRWMLYKKQRN